MTAGLAIWRGEKAGCQLLNSPVQLPANSYTKAAIIATQVPDTQLHYDQLCSPGESEGW